MVVELCEQVVGPNGAGDSVPPPVAEQCTKALAAAEQVAARIGEALEIIGDPPEVSCSLVEELLQPGVHDVD